MRDQLRRTHGTRAQGVACFFYRRGMIFYSSRENKSCHVSSLGQPEEKRSCHVSQAAGASKRNHATSPAGPMRLVGGLHIRHFLRKPCSPGCRPEEKKHATSPRRASRNKKNHATSHRGQRRFEGDAACFLFGKKSRALDFLPRPLSPAEDNRPGGGVE